MSFTQDVESPNVCAEEVVFPPGDLESNEPPLETYLHLQRKFPRTDELQREKKLE
ncbi:MAG: hypothetical protein Fur006_69790 [Coleofasciculaceae cyanobacterium]